jgi:hypothetical protein
MAFISYPRGTPAGNRTQVVEFRTLPNNPYQELGASTAI